MMPLINKPNSYQWPSNYLADFLSASLGITGVLGALRLREKTGEGSVVDCSLRDGLTYLSQFMKGQQYEYGNARKFTVEGTEFVVTTKEAVDEKQIVKSIREMEGDYYRSADGGVEASRVKDIPPFDINGIPNPFSSERRASFIREKGQDNEELLKKLLPKL